MLIEMDEKHSQYHFRVMGWKKHRFRLVGIIFMVISMLIPASVGQVTAQATDASLSSATETIQPAGSKTVVLARATWDTGWFQTEIFRQLLQALGYTVPEPKTHDNEDFYRLVATGAIDLWANGWFPLHNAYIKQGLSQEALQPVGYEVKSGALQGYLIDKNSADKLGIKSLADLKKPEVARLFDRDGNGKADLIGCNKGWGCEPVIEHHLDVYDLHDTVEHVQGEYSPLMTDTVAYHQSGRPVLFYTWTPNWIVGTLVPGKDVVWIETPFPSLPEGDKRLENQTTIPSVPGCVNDPCAMGFPPNDIRVVANKQFLANYPDVHHLLKLVAISPGAISAQNAKMIDGEDDDEDIRRHARQWITDNRATVGRWLQEARKFQGIHTSTELAATDEPRLPEKAVLQVVTKRFEPFVIYQDKTYVGFSIELWEKIAQNLGLQYRLFAVNTVAKLLDEVERGAADVAIAGISITSSREQVLDFSHAFFETGLQIMVPVGSESVLREVISKVFAVIFSIELFYGVAFFFIILIIAAHIIWVLERRKNPQFPMGYAQGLWQSIWWAVVTVTTVGYGDKTPKGVAGRLFGLFWILAGYFVFAYFTASVTTTATVQELHGTISGPGDLFGKKVATVEKSTAADYLAEQGVPIVVVDDIGNAFPLLESGKVDAVVYDAPVLQHYASKAGKGKVKVVGLLFQEQNYGIALQVESPYREKVNIALLELIESGAYKEIADKWFGG